MLTTIHFDGGCRPVNPGPPYGSYVIETDDGAVIHGPVRWRQPWTVKTNNEAEYLTLWLALNDVAMKFTERFTAPGINSLHIYSDSALVVNQMRAKWKVRERRLSELVIKCACLYAKITGITEAEKINIGWVPRRRMVELFGH